MQNQHHPDQPPPDFAKFLETGQEIDVSYFHTYKQEPIRMLCQLLTVGGDFLVIAKNPTQYKAIARLMQSAFPGVRMVGKSAAGQNLNAVYLDTEKGTFGLSFQGPLASNATEIPISEWDKTETA